METLEQQTISDSGPNDSSLIHAHAETAMLQYALAVVKGRALPRVEDGQKPVQRRILYAMQQLGLSHGAKPVKSARIIGEVLGKFHPHGDTAAYDAMVRQAQNFSLRYPLIDGQGNFGSLDGDSPAAMRYTEARLSPIADLLLSELGKGTVDFQPNYDGSFEEPCLVPARLPFLLLNGASGIAVGMATECPPHNLREVADAAALVVQNPETTLAEVMQHIQGPDFPGGGQLISSPEYIEAAYATGRNSLRCRARWVKEDLARGQWQIVITELPYQVSASRILEELETLTNPQPKAGKKTIDQQQGNLKQMSLEFLESATDESDKDNPLRLVLVPRTSKVDIDQMMAFLLANTSLEVSVPLNMTMIGLDGRPQTKSLLQVLQEWGSFRVTTVRRRTTYDLDVANKRIHILEGRMVVFLNLDAVIKVIREADEPKTQLMSAFSLSDIQATDILEMRLRQLNKLEGFKLERELDELRAEAARLQSLLDSDAQLRALVVSEIRADCVKFGDDRRTIVQVAERVTASSAAVRNVPDEEVTIVVSRNLWVKAYKGHDLAADAFAFKSGDGLLASVQTRTVKSVFIMDSKGRVYELDAAQVPNGRGDGAPLSTFVDIQDGAKVFSVLVGDENDTYLFGGTYGYGFLAPLKSLATRQRAGKAFLKLQDEHERPFPPLLLPKKTDTGKFPGYLLCGSTAGRMLAFSADEVNVYENGGKGVRLLDLDDNSVVSAVLTAEGEPFTAKLLLGGKEMSVKLAGQELWGKHVARRGNKGAYLPKKGVLQQ